jgi:LacI family transcriptional regulator
MTLMTSAIENGEAAVPGQFFLPFDIHIAENI